MSQEYEKLVYPTREKMIWMYEIMVRIREFDEFVKRSFEEYPGMIRGHTHPSDGEEAIVAGALAAINPDDYVGGTYRCHGITIGRGVPMKLVLAELWGKKTGICKGKGGSMHLCDMSRNLLPACAIVAQGIPHATGVALACQIKRTGQIVLCFFGDGATKQGAFFESLNIASLWKLPIVYILENNLYQAYTRVELEDANTAAGENLSVKARAFSMPGVTVDGMDPIAVYRAVYDAAKRAREGKGPTLIECVCYRFSAHGNAIVAPPMPTWFPKHEAIEVYANPREYEEWRKKDPITRFKAFLINIGALTEDQAKSIEESAKREVEEAVKFALESPFPAPEEALEDIYA